MWLFIVPLLFLVVILMYSTSTNKNKKYPPGPWWRWPWFGNMPLVKARGGLTNATLSLSEELNAEIIGLYTSGTYSVTACSPAAVKEVLTKPDFLGRPNNFFTYLRSLRTNKGVTMTDGPHWQEQRTFLVKQLSDVGFGRDLMNIMIEDSLRDLIKNLGEGGPQVNLGYTLSRSVINILWRITTGSEIPDEKLKELTSLMLARSKAFDSAGGWLAQMPWLRHILPNWSGYNIILQINNRVKKFIMDTINEHKATYKQGMTRDFIDAFLHKMYEAEHKNTTFTEDQLMMVCLDLFIGGIMTTSNTLDFCFLRMVHHPDVQAKAQAELDDILGNKLPTVEDRKRLPYMRALINECLRINILVPVSGPRRTVKTTTLAGYVIPENTTIFIHMYPTSMNPELFPEPEKFKPERFLDANKNDDDTNFTSNYPFGFGKRRCPGEVLARNYIFLILSGLLHQYKLGPPHRMPVPTLEPNVGITRTPKPYTLSLAKRFKTDSSY